VGEAAVTAPCIL